MKMRVEEILLNIIIYDGYLCVELFFIFIFVFKYVFVIILCFLNVFYLAILLYSVSLLMANSNFYDIGIFLQQHQAYQNGNEILFVIFFS